MASHPLELELEGEGLVSGAVQLGQFLTLARTAGDGGVAHAKRTAPNGHHRVMVKYNLELAPAPPLQVDSPPLFTILPTVNHKDQT